MKVEYSGPDTGGATTLLSGMHYEHTEVPPTPPSHHLPPLPIRWNPSCVSTNNVLKGLLVEHAAHMLYVAEAWDARTNTLRDLSDSERHADLAAVSSTGRQRKNCADRYRMHGSAQESQPILGETAAQRPARTPALSYPATFQPFRPQKPLGLRFWFAEARDMHPNQVPHGQCCTSTQVQDCTGACTSAAWVGGDECNAGLECYCEEQASPPCFGKPPVSLCSAR